MFTAIKQAGRRRSSTSSTGPSTDTKLEPTYHSSSIAKAFRMKDPSNIPFLRRMRRKSKPSPLKTVAFRRELSTDSAKGACATQSPSSIYSEDDNEESKQGSLAPTKLMQTIAKHSDRTPKLANTSLIVVRDDSPSMPSPSWVRLQRKQLSPRNDSTTPDAKVEVTGEPASPIDTPKSTGKKAAKKVAFAELFESDHSIHEENPRELYQIACACAPTPPPISAPTSDSGPEIPIPKPSPLRVPDRQYRPQPLTPAPWTVNATTAARINTILAVKACYTRSLEEHHISICGSNRSSLSRRSPPPPARSSTGSSDGSLRATPSTSSNTSSGSLALRRRSRVGVSELETLAEEQGMAMQGLEKEE